MSNFKEGQTIISTYLKHLSAKPGIYQMIDVHDQILYIGKAKNIKKRVSNYTVQNRLTNRIQRMISQTKKMTFIYTNTEIEALLLESNLIKKHAPFFNVLLKDDKSFAYIEITDDTFPLIKKFRGKKQKARHYFGPFPSAGSIEKTITSLQKAFKLRNCNNHMFGSRTRPCLQYQIQRCSAPCVGKVTATEYQKQKKDAIQFLEGKTQKVQKKLSDLMHQASKDQAFEKAAKLRDRIQALSSIQSKQDIHLTHLKNADFIAAYQIGEETAIEVCFYRAGSNYGSKTYFPKYQSKRSIEDVLSAFISQFYTNHQPPEEIYLSYQIEEMILLSEAFSYLEKKKIKLIYPIKGQKKQIITTCISNAKHALERKLLSRQSHLLQLEQLEKTLDLKRFPKRIEVYDNSHLFGKHAYGAMIVSNIEGFDKQSYRLYKIKSEAIKGDDCGMMREVLNRRFKNSDAQEGAHFPDLILLDGGKGQLNIVHAILKEKNLGDQIDLIAISKGPNRNAGEEDFHKIGCDSFKLKKNDPSLFLLQRLRDEAHRFGISTHRKSRKKGLEKSALDQIEGIGPKRKKSLLSHFGSPKILSQAGIEDLKSIEGISQAIAEKIYYHFHEK